MWQSKIEPLKNRDKFFDKHTLKVKRKTIDPLPGLPQMAPFLGGESMENPQTFH